MSHFLLLDYDSLEEVDISGICGADKVLKMSDTYVLMCLDPGVEPDPTPDPSPNPPPSEDPCLKNVKYCNHCSEEDKNICDGCSEPRILKNNKCIIALCEDEDTPYYNSDSDTCSADCPQANDFNSDGFPHQTIFPSFI